MAVRVSRLAEPRTVTNHAEYAGCKSWVPLRPGDVVEEAGQPVIDDGPFGWILEQVDTLVGGGHE